MATVEQAKKNTVSKIAPTELTAQQIAYEELAHDAQCDRNNRYSAGEGEAMLGFNVVGPYDTDC